MDHIQYGNCTKIDFNPHVKVEIPVDITRFYCLHCHIMTSKLFTISKCVMIQRSQSTFMNDKWVFQKLMLEDFVLIIRR